MLFCSPIFDLNDPPSIHQSQDTVVPLPPVLAFESWWNEGKERVHVAVDFESATGMCTARCGVCALCWCAVRRGGLLRKSVKGVVWCFMENIGGHLLADMQFVLAAVRKHRAYPKGTVSRLLTLNDLCNA